MQDIDIYDFYRCRECNRLFTKLDEARALMTGDVCPCGSRRYSPSWPVGTEWLLPRVLKLLVHKLIRE